MMERERPLISAVASLWALCELPAEEKGEFLSGSVARGMLGLISMVATLFYPLVCD